MVECFKFWRHSVLVAVLLSACGPVGNNSIPSFPWLDQMSVGLTRSEVRQVRGEPVRSIQTSRGICDTYHYNQPMPVYFVHVYYIDDVVVASSDRHLGVCRELLD